SLNDCSEETCQMYVTDVIMETFSIPINVVSLLKDIILCITCTVCGSISLANCETVLYFYGDVIMQYVTIFSLIKGTDINQLEMSVEQMLPSFDLLVQITNNLCRYFSNINIDEFIFVMHRLCVAMTPIISLMFEFSTKHKSREVEQLLSQCRAIEVRRLCVAHFGLAAFPIETKGIGGQIHFLSSIGLLSSNEVIPSILKAAEKSGLLKQNKYSHFIHDLLAIAKKVENMNNEKEQQAYKSVVTKLFFDTEKLTATTSNGIAMVKLQRLEEMVRNQWIDKTMHLNSPEALLLNRVLEQIYLDSTTTIDLNVNMLENNRIIEKISKLKALLTKHIYWIAANVDLMDFEENNELFKRLGECVSLLSQFANEDKKLEYSLHIWAWTGLKH
ncbi:hypothetical protein RFI_33889, partial [Reticulomyxa filosa]